MESNPRLHPLLAAAAISVIVVSAAGVGALTGILPKSTGSTPAAAPAAPLEVVTPPVPGAAPAATPAAPPTPPKAVKKPVVRAAAPVESRPVKVAREDDYSRAEDLREQRRTERRRARQAERQQVVQATCRNCGTVEAVRAVETPGEGSWVGPVAGGVGGAIIGRQFGNGGGRTLMTILGAAGGAYAGHEIEKRARSSTRWEVSVRMDDGGTRTVSYDTQPAWQGGQRVRYVNGTLVAEQHA